MIICVRRWWGRYIVLNVTKTWVALDLKLNSIVGTYFWLCRRYRDTLPLLADLFRPGAVVFVKVRFRGQKDLLGFIYGSKRSVRVPFIGQIDLLGPNLGSNRSVKVSSTGQIDLLVPIYGSNRSVRVSSTDQIDLLGSHLRVK